MRFRPLANGAAESVIVKTRPHWRAAVRPILVLLIGALLAGIAAGLAETQLPQYAATPPETFPLIVAVIAAIYGIAVLLFAVVPLLRWRGQTLMLTDHRIVGRSGVFHRTGFDIPLVRVNAVRYRHTLSDRLFGTGTLIVESSNGFEYEFSDVPHIAEIHEVMYNQVAHAHRY